MTATEFRRLALGLPEATENAHMGHPDFRVRGKIFATLGYPDEQHAVVMLPPEEQRRLLELDPTVFAPAKGAWGRQGATAVRLSSAAETTVESALARAWCRKAPKRLVKETTSISITTKSARR
jgi:hypothetical protein